MHGITFSGCLMNSKIAPKTRAIVNIDMLFYMNNACMSHCTFQIEFLCTVFFIDVCILFTTKPYSTHTKCDWSLYFWFVFDMVISLRLKIQSLSLLWSSCENFRPLAEAKCHTVWKMIVVGPCWNLKPQTKKKKTKTRFMWYDDFQDTWLLTLSFSNSVTLHFSE